MAATHTILSLSPSLEQQHNVTPVSASHESLTLVGDHEGDNYHSQSLTSLAAVCSSSLPVSMSNDGRALTDSKSEGSLFTSATVSRPHTEPWGKATSKQPVADRGELQIIISPRKPPRKVRLQIVSDSKWVGWVSGLLWVVEGEGGVGHIMAQLHAIWSPLVGRLDYTLRLQLLDWEFTFFVFLLTHSIWQSQMHNHVFASWPQTWAILTHSDQGVHQILNLRVFNEIWNHYHSWFSHLGIIKAQYNKSTARFLLI